MTGTRQDDWKGRMQNPDPMVGLSGWALTVLT